MGVVRPAVFGENGRRRIRVNPTNISVFDLSPAGKLQLVEDLWDDLASNPDSVPVQEWQTRELERRKENLSLSPASVQVWPEVKNRLRREHDR